MKNIITDRIKIVKKIISIPYLTRSLKLTPGDLKGSDSVGEELLLTFHCFREV